MSRDFFDETPNAKLLSLKRYKDLISDIRTQGYRVITMAAELRRPSSELETVVALMKGFDEKWWQLQRDIEKAEEARGK